MFLEFFAFQCDIVARPCFVKQEITNRKARQSLIIFFNRGQEKRQGRKTETGQPNKFPLLPIGSKTLSL